MAAGGIVLRREQPPLIAVVRLRKRDEWVLPKGKLDEGETPRAAAKREVLEETGHSVTVHEFLGTLVYDSGGRSKVVHYWRMEASGTQTRELMSDIRAVDWLPLEAAIARLSRASERTFLENVGPLAVSVLSRRLKAKAQAPAANKMPAADKAPAAAAKKRRVKPPLVAPELPQAEPAPALPMEGELLPQPVASEAATQEALVDAATADAAQPFVDAEFVPQPDIGEGEMAAEHDDSAHDADAKERKSLAQKVRNWLGRAA
jgi:8-oxo-dGTP diphosphatase